LGRHEKPALNKRFTTKSTERLQHFLGKYGRLPITSDLDSLAVGTLQGYLRELQYYDDKPCGVLGPGTIRALQMFLKDNGAYGLQITASLDSETKKAMNDFLYRNKVDQSKNRRRHDHLWTRSTTRNLRTYMHDKHFKVQYTGEKWGEHFPFGRWESKTTQILQQFLNDNLPGEKLDITKNMNYQTIVALRKYLNLKMTNEQHSLVSEILSAS